MTELEQIEELLYEAATYFCKERVEQRVVQLRKKDIHIDNLSAHEIAFNEIVIPLMNEDGE